MIVIANKEKYFKIATSLILKQIYINKICFCLEIEFETLF